VFGGSPSWWATTSPLQRAAGRGAEGRRPRRHHAGRTGAWLKERRGSPAADTSERSISVNVQRRRRPGGALAGHAHLRVRRRRPAGAAHRGTASGRVRGRRPPGCLDGAVQRTDWSRVRGSPGAQPCAAALSTLE
jgi:hypothetical protein